MTEKRFVVTQTVLGSGIYDFQAENELCESYDEDAYGKVVKRLNELAEENEQLKDALNQRTVQCDKYYEENEQLKQQLKQKEELIDEVWQKYEDAHGMSIDNTDWF